MNEPTIEAAGQPKGFLTRAIAAWQWLVAAIIGLFTLMLLISKHQLQAPGAPVILFWSTLAIGLLIAAAHTPPAFLRFPGKAKGAAYLSILAYLLLFGFMLTELQGAWEKTPRGAAEAKQNEMERQAALKVERDRQRIESQLAEGQRLQQKIADHAIKLEGCFTKLEKSVQESLHNPHAFEHVETFAIEPDLSGNNVAMRFRAENAAGALRTWIIKASVDPDSCEITRMGNPEQA
jgi:hypothetical protein